MSAAETCEVCGKVYVWDDDRPYETVVKARNCCAELKKEPILLVNCFCGEQYSLHNHTVCPRCSRFPKYNWSIRERGE